MKKMRETPSPRPGRSLATRISLVVAAIVALVGAASGFGLYTSVRQSLKTEFNGRLDAHLDWLQSSIDCEDEHLEFEPKTSHAQNSDAWCIKIKNGDLLWSQNWREHESGFKYKSRIIAVGETNGTLIQAHSLPPFGSESLEKSAFGRYRLPGHPARIELILTTGASETDLKRELGRLALGLWTVGPLTILFVSFVLSFFIRWQLAS